MSEKLWTLNFKLNNLKIMAKQNSNISTSQWLTALTERDDLTAYSDNAIGLFALALKFGIDDLESVGAESICDGGNDKKNDIIYIDLEQQRAVLIQAYRAKAPKQAAPANKASDLNTALAWLLVTPEKDLPAPIRAHTLRLRDGIRSNAVKDLHVWYVHNCQESLNVQNELDTVKHSLASALNSNFHGLQLNTSVLEVGNSTLQGWYSETQSPIMVTEDFTFQCPGGYEMKGKRWKAFVTSIAAVDLYSVYRKPGVGVKLFSANVRDYLGSRDADTNINNGIKQTIKNSAGDFWVYNNGLTVLTHAYESERDLADTTTSLKVSGISIVNGAQTTGAIGHLETAPPDSARVQVRFVSTTDNNLIQDIVRYNNSQNHISAADFRSTDAIQKRLKDEVILVPNAEYEGGRRGGASDAIRRRAKLMPSYTVGQALASFHGDPVMAYNKKTEIWVNDAMYAKFFNERTSGTHLIFTYSLLRAVENKKTRLIEKSNSEQVLTESEQSQLDFFRLSGATFVYVAAIAKSLEAILSRPIPDRFSLSFGDRVAPLKAVERWIPIVEATIAFTKTLKNLMQDKLSQQVVENAVSAFSQMVDSVAENHQQAFDKFERQVRHGRPTSK
jgi:hypothetical protein